MKGGKVGGGGRGGRKRKVEQFRDLGMTLHSTATASPLVSLCESKVNCRKGRKKATNSIANDVSVDDLDHR